MIRKLDATAGAKVGPFLGTACLAVAAVLTLGTRVAAAPVLAPREASGRVAELLLADSGGLCTQLGALGPEAMSPLFDILERHAYVVDGVRHPLTRAQREVVLRAIGRMPDRDLRALYTELTDPAASPTRKAVAIEVMGTNAGAADMRSMIALAYSDAGARERRNLARQLEESLASVLARDVRGFGYLASIVGDVPENAREAVVRAMGEERSPAAVGPLSSMLGAFPATDAAILGQLARVTAQQRLVPNEGALDRVRPYLEHENVHLQSSAALVLGRLEDFQSVPTLIGFLHHPNRGMQEQALWSLRRISGLGLRADVERWKSWHRRELEWWQQRSGELFGELRSSDAAVAVQAVNEVARRRLFRNELANELARALVHHDPRVGRQASDALRQIGSPAAVPALIDCLNYPDPAVRDAVWEALKEITGRDLPPDPQEWRAAFPG